MGIFGNFFAKEQRSDDDGDADTGERLSASDAEDIWLSSGQDEDYDFRDDGNEDESEDGPIPDDFDAKKQVEDYMNANAGDQLEEPSGTPPKYNEHSVYTFVCGTCEGFGYHIIPDPFSSQAETSTCEDCFGNRSREYEGQEAMEKLELWEEVPLSYY